MPQVVAFVKAVAAAWSAFAVKHAIIAAIIKAVAVAAISAGVSRALTRKSSLSSLRAQATEVNVRDPAFPRDIVYGQPKKSGVLYPVGVSGANNDYLHLLILVAGHECEELGDVYFNDEIVPLDGSGNATGRYAGNVRVIKHRGEWDQTVDTALQADLGIGYWSNDHRLRGIAYLYIRLKNNPDLFAGGMPEFRCITKGRKVYDPRDGGHSATDAATWTWSQNAALAQYDWLRGAPMRNGAGVIVRNFSLGASDAEVNQTALIEAANISDEDVVLDDTTTEKRYTANGWVSTSVRAGDGIDLFKSSMAGDCVWIGGEWFIRSGAYRTPTVTLDEGDLRAPLQGVRLKPSRRDLFNVVKGVYVAPDNQWQPADFPPVSNATYKTQDGGEDLPGDIEFPLTTSNATAQRLAKIMLEESRQGIMFTARCKLTAMQVQATDVIQFTNTRFGWSSKPFQVIGFAFAVEDDANGNPYLGVDLALKETAAGVFDWANGEETVVDLAPNTTLPDPFTVPTPSTPTLASGAANAYLQNDGTTVPRLKVSWTAPTNTYVLQGGFVRIEYKPTAGPTWYVWSDVRGDVVEEFITDIRIGVSFDVRLQFVNSNGVRGSYSATAAHTVTGDTSGPATPTGLAAVVGTGKSVSLDWDDNTEADFSEYAIYRNTGGADTKIAETRASRFVDVDVALGTAYNYAVTAIDRSENASAKSAYVAATPTAVAAGSVDGTAPSTPSAGSKTGQGTYLSGDGSVFAYLDISVPALPTLGAYQNLLYKKNGGGGDWLIAAQLTNTGTQTVRIDDLTPGVIYDVAVQAFSAFAIASVITACTSSPFTAPNKSTGPGAPTSVSLSTDDIPLAFVPSTSLRLFGSRVRWDYPADKDIAYFEVKATVTNTDGATDYTWSDGSPMPMKLLDRTVVLYDFDLSAGHVRVRAIDRTGNASSWVYAGNANGTAYLSGGNMSEQDSDSIEISGIKTGAAGASSVREVLARYPFNGVVSLAGGSPTEKVNVSLSNRGFSTKPDTAGGPECTNDNLVLVRYDWDDGSSSSTNAVLELYTRDGSNLSTSYRLDATFEEYD